MNIFKIAAFIVTFSAMRLSADLIDDLEDGDFRNELGFNWAYFTTACDSEIIITNAVADEEGRYTLIPVSGIGFDEGYAAQMSWHLDRIRAAECISQSTAGIVISLCFDSDDGVHWFNATELSFYARADSTHPMRVEFIVSASRSYARFYKDIGLTTEWERYTVQFSDLVQYESEEQATFDAYRIKKIAFNIVKDIEEIPETGSIYIDDVEVNDTIIAEFTDVFNLKAEKPGRSDTIEGSWWSNFEGDHTDDLNRPEISQFKTKWYLFDDSEKAGKENTVFTDGFKVNPEDSEKELHINVGGKEGYDSTQGIKVSFKLGTPIHNNETVTQPFAGIGCMLSNSEEFKAGIDSSLKTTDASNATGLYFDYKTVASNDKFRYFLFELYDSDSLPEGLSFHMQIPATNGMWKGVSIPFDDLFLVDINSALWDSLSGDQRGRDMKRLDRMQFKFQNIKETEIDVWFDNFKFVGDICGPYGCEEHVISSINRKHTSPATLLMSRNGLKVTLNNLPGGIHNGNVELIGINGTVIDREKINARSGYSLLMKTDGLADGVYILRVNTRYGNGKKYSFTDRLSVYN
jgi:hypothetical protein